VVFCGDVVFCGNVVICGEVVQLQHHVDYNSGEGNALAIRCVRRSLECRRKMDVRKLYSLLHSKTHQVIGKDHSMLVWEAWRDGVTG
jgi:hypothetical protein